MKFLPFDNITYKTKLEPDQVLQRLTKKVESKRTFRMTGIFSKKNHKPYQGTIDGNSFQISRIIHYRNSFLPQIKGAVEKDWSGSKVTVKMRLHTFVLVFAMVWFGIVGFVGAALVLSSWSDGGFDPATLIPVGMIVFFYLLTIFAYKYESNKTKEFFTKLWEATEAEW